MSLESRLEGMEGKLAAIHKEPCKMRDEEEKSRNDKVPMETELQSACSL